MSNKDELPQENIEELEEIFKKSNPIGIDNIKIEEFNEMLKSEVPGFTSCKPTGYMVEVVNINFWLSHIMSGVIENSNTLNRCLYEVLLKLKRCAPRIAYDMNEKLGNMGVRYLVKATYNYNDNKLWGLSGSILTILLELIKDMLAISKRIDNNLMEHEK